MQKVLQQLSVILVLVLIVVSSGFTMYKHYCGGHLQKIQFNKKTAVCHDTFSATTPPCHHNTHTQPACHQTKNKQASKHGDCCENEVSWQQVDQYVVQDDITTPLPFLAIAVTHRVPQWLSVAYFETSTPMHDGQPPPLLAHQTEGAGLQVFRL